MSSVVAQPNLDAGKTPLIAEPFLKWPGGKRWLATTKPSIFEIDHRRYFEPFLGGGAVFFGKQPKSSFLSDVNARLIETYRVVRDEPDALTKKLRAHQRQHSEEHYYSIRSTKPRSAVGRAAQFIYLNRTCWNGLYRLNLKGEFNVPIGTKTKVIGEDEDFRLVAQHLALAELAACDFEETIEKAGQGDLIFADPPYTVKHNFNGFIKYNENMFSWDDQVRLKDALIRADKRGVLVIATNAAHESIKALYRRHFRQTLLNRASVISGKASGRGIYGELLISNCL